jgi:2-keto-4-pentenoate hydratase
MDPSHIAEAAALLVAARQQRSRIGLLPEVCRPRSVADAHAIQDAVTAVLGATVGATVGAFKANAPAGSEAMRAPIYAPIHASPARMSARDVPQCGVEGEVAFRFRRDLPSRPTPYRRDEIAAALDACVAIEVVTSRFADPDAATLLDKLADCVSNGGLVYGELTEDWRGLELGKLKVTLTVNGETVVEQAGGHPTGDPLGIAVALVDMMRESGGVREGQFVTCGSYTGLRYLKPGDVCGVRFDGLGTAEVAFTQ